MRKWFLKTVSLLCCLSMLTMLGACGNKDKKTESDNVGLIDFDDERGDGIQSGNDSETSSDVSSNASSSTGSTSESEPVNISGNDPFANIPKNLKGSTLTFAHFGDEGAAEYKKVIEAFTKKTRIKVKLVAYDQDAYVSTVSKQIAAKSGPDVVICNEIFPAGLEIAQPIQNYIDLNDSFWDPQVSEITTVGDNTYFVNSMKSVWYNIDMCFYNTQLFSKNGITSPADYYKNGKWTYENLRVCLEKVAATKNTGGYVDPMKMSASLGTPLVSFDTKKDVFTQNVGKAATAYQYCAANIQNGLWDPARWFAQFTSGTIGLYVQSAYGCKYNGWFKETNPAILGVVPTPTSYQGKACKQSATLRCYGIAKGAKNPQAAAYFLRYFLDYGYYKDAGANVFINNAMEKAYFDEMALAEKEGINYYFDTNAFSYTSAKYEDLKKVAELSPVQVAAKLSSYENQFTSAAAKMTEKLNSAK